MYLIVVAIKPINVKILQSIFMVFNYYLKEINTWLVFYFKKQKCYDIGFSMNITRKFNNSKAGIKLIKNISSKYKIAILFWK